MKVLVFGLSFVCASMIMYPKGNQKRDPFFSPSSVKIRRVKKKQFKIVGFIQCNKAQGVLIENESDKQKTLMIGDMMNGYKLTCIAANYIELKKNKKVKRVKFK